MHAGLEGDGTDAVPQHPLMAVPKEFPKVPDFFRNSTNQANLLKIFLGLFS